MKLPKLINKLSFKDTQYLWLLLIVLVLFINAFNSILTISHHQDASSTVTAAVMMDHHGEHGVTVKHCGDAGQSACADNTVDYDCSISHCSPAGLVGIAALPAADAGATTYLEYQSNYQFLAASTPYIPPITAHI